jgi:cyclase
MLRRRLIPVVLLREGVVVQSKGFKRYQRLGNPTTIVQRLSDWASDELVYLDISRGREHDLGRDDLGDPSRRELLDILRDVSRQCFMPLAFGGGIHTLRDCELRLAAGADKVVVNSQALTEPSFIETLAREFGSQCVVVSIDGKSTGPRAWEVVAQGGRLATGRNLTDWIVEVQDRGAGEILLQSIDRDGMGAGYDIEMLKAARQVARVPMIAMSGVGEWSHLAEGIALGGADAVAAANIFNYSENSVYTAKDYLVRQGFPFRPPTFRHEEASP